MKKFIILTDVLLVALCVAGASTLDRVADNSTFHHENVLGTSLELKFDAMSRMDADAAEAAALAEIDRLAKILSSYDKTSEFSRWFRTSGQPIAVSPELLEVLSLFDRYRAATGGALDPAAEAIGRVWKAAAAQNRMPSAAELAAAVEAVQRKHWKIEGSTVTHLDDTQLALNSFTKSYIIGRAADAALAAGGVTSAVVNIGGDIVVRGERAQIVNIADPFADAENVAPMARLSVGGSAVATSGNYRRGVEIGGQHYSHIVDPRTGLTAEQIVSATVVAKNPSDAGALATAFSVLTPAESKLIARQFAGAEFLLVQRDGSRIKSSGWSKLEVPPMMLAAAAPAAQAGGGWNTAYELSITLALGRIDDPRYRRPFVAVWIEDKDKFPVRTIALWFDKARWLPELKAWYRDDRMRALAEGTDITATVSSATRPPGKYTLKWDGKDNSGKLVKPGKYTVVIEASREHGGYQVLHQEMDFSGVPKQFNLTGNSEIEAATLDYRKSTPR